MAIVLVVIGLSAASLRGVFLLLCLAAAAGYGLALLDATPRIAGGQIGRYTFQPGWRWSECIKQVVGTDTCQVEHIGYCVAGTLHVRHDDGTEGDVKPGDVYRVSPGHDAWTVGDQAAVFVEFQGAANYAKPS